METTASCLPGPIQRGLDISKHCFPAAAGHMAAALPRLLAPLLAAGADSPAGPSPWSTSLLTDGGYPFEFTCTTLNDSLRYTLEVAPPRDSPRTRLAQTVALVQELTGQAPDAETLVFLEQLQAGSAPRYGAWLGVRHHAGGSAYKIYVEVPPAGRDAAMAYLNRRLQRPVGVKDRSIELQMIGWYPATGELEFYLRVVELRPWEIAALMHPLGLEAGHRLVLDEFQAAYGRPLFRQLPGGIWGFSYALPPAGTAAAPAFTCYTFAETLFGRDAYTHARLARYFEQGGVAMDHYTQLSAPTVAHTGRWTHHGMFGITWTPGIRPVAHIGLRPPLACPADV